MDRLSLELQTQIFNSLLEDVTAAVTRMANFHHRWSNIDDYGPPLTQSLTNLRNLSLTNRSLKAVTDPFLNRALEDTLRRAVKVAPWQYIEAQNSGQVAVDNVLARLMSANIFRNDHVVNLGRLAEHEDRLLFDYLESICVLPEPIRRWAVRMTAPKELYTFPPGDLPFDRNGSIAHHMNWKRPWESLWTIKDWLEPHINPEARYHWFRRTENRRHSYGREDVGFLLNKEISHRLHEGFYQGLLALLKAFNPEAVILGWNQTIKQVDIAAETPEKYWAKTQTARLKATEIGAKEKVAAQKALGRKKAHIDAVSMWEAAEATASEKKLAAQGKVAKWEAIEKKMLQQVSALEEAAAQKAAERQATEARAVEEQATGKLRTEGQAAAKDEASEIAANDKGKATEKKISKEGAKDGSITEGYRVEKPKRKQKRYLYERYKY
ncbi:uncharacterized protein KY384_000791 [Bacidia gigantensis]|uniref:uncharacterized protein n=1 Tax=Bacidia gigantensis TaxID=2732470 RepID=UPI001D037B4A|nr:uncharacterized protein KY384_000791 [Bacidia gigantensis]KAG8526029.1 hypothetical protein KY384_000791 [Bacidia gigantensis]